MPSQNDEDEVLARLLARIPDCPRYCVEIGANRRADGRLECNTATLLEAGWQGVLIDERPLDHPKAVQRRVTASNVADVFAELEVPFDFGVLSIDIDGLDWWVWEALPGRWRPRVVVIEYNAELPACEHKVMPYDEDYSYDGSAHFGASAGAMVDLAMSKGYVLIAESCHVNLFFAPLESLGGRQVGAPRGLDPTWEWERR